MNFVDDLKKRIKRHGKQDFVQDLRKNPEYEHILTKLKELTEKREALYNMLRKVELEIDACLVVIEMKKEQDEINKDLDVDKENIKKWRESI